MLVWDGPAELGSHSSGTDLPSSLPAERPTRAMSVVTTTRFSRHAASPANSSKTSGPSNWLEGLPASASTWAIDQIASCATDESGNGSGRLLVGISQDRRCRQAWLSETASLWQEWAGGNLIKMLPPVQPLDGKGIAKELRRARASGSLEALRKSLTLELPPARARNSKTRQTALPQCVLIDRLDTAGTREDDQLLLCQLIDAILNQPTLLAVTLPGHPATLSLHPAVESRLEAGLIIPLGHGQRPVPARSHASSKSSPLHGRHASPKGDSSVKKRTPRGIKPSLRPPTIRRIISAVARYYDLEADDIVGSSQRRCHVRPRGLAIHCAHLLTGKSSHAIGRAIGGRDHTTILHSLKVSTNLMQHDSGYAGDFAAMIEHLTGQPPRRS